MDLLQAICGCLTGRDDTVSPETVNDKQKLVGGLKPSEPTEEELASSILSTLFTAEKRGRDLENRLRDLVHTTGWYEGLAQRILDGLVAALNAGAAMGAAMKEAYDKASAIASDFAEAHPVLTAALVTVVAIGILVILVPWAVEALGFGELGPIAGEHYHPLYPSAL
jgi:hypothetical protein